MNYYLNVKDENQYGFYNSRVIVIFFKNGYTWIGTKVKKRSQSLIWAGSAKCALFGNKLVEITLL